MVKVYIPLLIAGFFFELVVCSAIENSNIAGPGIHQSKTWCVVRGSAPADKLQGFIDYACTQVDCVDIRPGGKCFKPETLQNHASYALNLIYRATGSCNLDIGYPAITDPSYGTCQYT